MRVLGIILVSLGIALLIYIGYIFLKEQGKTVSPLPEEKGVKVIFVTPTK